MESTWDGNTRGLGAGSYPEPPDIPEYEYPVCEECGDDGNLAEIDGKTLCWHCRQKHYIKTAKESQKWEFIHHDEPTRLQFFKDYWFNSLDNYQQFLILRMGFTNTYMHEKSKRKQLALITDFCEANLDEFASFVEGIA